MARNKSTLTNIDKSDLFNFPYGRIKDNDGSGNGTPVNEFVYGDIHETFAKLLRLYGIPYNGLPDNETNGYQLVNALVALASKNDFLLNLTVIDATTLSMPVKLSKLKTGEAFTCLAASGRTTQTLLVGSLDTTPSSLAVTFKGGNFLANDYVRVVRTAGGVDIIRLADGDSLDAIAADFNYLKAASQAEEDAGALNTVATTPLTNFTTFSNRVIGAQSGNFLATAARNGLLSMADKAKLDGLGGSNDRYGTILIGDVNSVSRPIGFHYPVTGDIDDAVVVGKDGAGELITVTLDPGMADTDYFCRIFGESLGTFNNDDDMLALFFKKINSTQFQVHVEQSSGSVQNVRLHIEVIQK